MKLEEKTMGTRSLTLIKNENGDTICNMYRQYDGYPSGHGAELAAFLQTGELVNGFGTEPTFAFNGMGCLAASLVKHFKDGIGNIYLEPPDARDCGEEYIYTVYLKDGKICLKVEAGAMTAFGLPGTKQENMNTLFDDDINHFTVVTCELAEKQQPQPPNDFLDEQKKADD
ncbi:MAG: hypothetical protein KJ941_01020 [Bacteroidetes bacterium]|nr:hypothetical protein [Bacteroidota bacterium]